MLCFPATVIHTLHFCLCMCYKHIYIRIYTVNKEFYLNVLKRFREAVRRKRLEACTNNTWMLHHDNAPAHASLLIREFLTKHETTVVPQPPYSPDLAPADFFLFQKLKSSLKVADFRRQRREKKIR